MFVQLQWIVPVLCILTGLFVGIIAEQHIFKKLKKIATDRRIPGSEILFKALHRMTFFWFFLAAFYAGVVSYPLPPNLAATLQRIITISFLYTITLVAARLTGGFVSLLVQRTETLSASLLSNIAKAAVLVMGILILLQTAGIQVTPLIATLGIGGLAVGLALKDTLENLFSGIYLIISRQIKTGDYIKLEESYEGYVTDITWRHTTIRELCNNVIIVPNSKLSTAIFTNYHLPAKQITLSINFGISYDSDLEEVERITIEVAKEVMAEVAPNLIDDNEPFVRYQRFGEFSIEFTVYIRVNEFYDQRMARHLFIKKLHKRYRQENIKVPFPTREVYSYIRQVGENRAFN